MGNISSEVGKGGISKKTKKHLLVIFLLSLTAIALWLGEILFIKGWHGLNWLSGPLYSPFLSTVFVVAAFLISFIHGRSLIKKNVILAFCLLYIVGIFCYIAGAVQLEWQGQENSKYLYFLLELDSDKTSVQLDPILRVYYKEVLAAFNKRDYTGIEKYLGDEDVLVANYFTIPYQEEHKGVYKADKYHYTLSFTWKK